MPTVREKRRFGELLSFETTGPLSDRINRAIRVLRSYLGMDVAFVSEFAAGRQHFRYVDGVGDQLPIQIGGSASLADTYCQRVIDGRLPELVNDAASNAVASALPVTHILPVGAYMGVPIRLSSGRLYGTFCCFSYAPDHSLNERDLRMMRSFAELTAHAIESDLDTRRVQKQKSERIRAVLERDELLSVVYQPIFNLESGRVVGLEALARISGTPQRTPDIWFADAVEVGLGAELELLSIRKSLGDLTELPAPLYMSFNISPSTLTSGRMGSVLRGRPLNRLGLEITEHAPIPDYDRVNRVLRPLRKHGLRVAVDDAGSGYSSLQHILNLKPDLIKLDVGLIRKIDKDSDRRAMVAALVTFSQHAGCRMTAEGIETKHELDELRRLGVGEGQGYLLGRPVPFAEARMRYFATVRGQTGT